MLTRVHTTTVRRPEKLYLKSYFPKWFVNYLSYVRRFVRLHKLLVNINFLDAKFLRQIQE